jgi:hypothetical protein
MARARAAMTLSGHLDVSWSIVIEAKLAEPLAPTLAASRLNEALALAPGLGHMPELVSFGPGGMDSLRQAFADDPYPEGGPVIRVGVRPEPEPAVLLAAHHGALDGLGLLALLGVALGARVASSARGLGDRGPARSFAGAAARRVTEALLFPPHRIASQPGAGRGLVAAGDELAALPVPPFEGGTPALVGAAAQAVRRWNRDRSAPIDRLVMAVGASRRPGTAPTLEEGSAYLRLRLQSTEQEDIRRALGKALPQPAAPALTGLGPLAPFARRLSGRLGSTMLVSNLGRLTGPAELLRVAFYPVAHGRSGVAFGAATVRGVGVLTIRARRRDFDREAARQLLTLAASELSITPGNRDR